MGVACLPPDGALWCLARLLADLPVDEAAVRKTAPPWRGLIMRLALAPSAPERATGLADALAAWGYDDKEQGQVGAALLGVRVRDQATAPSDDWFMPQSAHDLLAKDFPPPTFAVRGIIPEGLTLLVAPPKIGKSMLMLHFALAISRSGLALGEIPVDGGEVLYFSLEDPEQRVQRRLRTMLNGQPVPDGLYFQYAGRAMEDGLITRLGSWLDEHPDTRLIVLDTFARVRGKLSNSQPLYNQDYNALAPLQDFAKGRRIPVVVVHHSNKGSHDDFIDDASGSTGLTGVVDTVAVLKRERLKENEALIMVASKDIDEEMQHRYKFDPATMTFTLLESGIFAALTDEQNEIVAILGRGVPAGMAPRDINLAMGRKPDASSTRMMLKRLVRDGKVVHDGKLYRLPAAPLRVVQGGKTREA